MIIERKYKIGGFNQPYKDMMNEEKASFKEKYGSVSTDTADISNTPKTTPKIIGLIIGSVVLLLILVVGLPLILPENLADQFKDNIEFFIIPIVGIYFFLLAKTFGKQMKQPGPTLKQMLDHINLKERDTDLKKITTESTGGMSSLNFEQAFNGTFRGRKVKCSQSQSTIMGGQKSQTSGAYRVDMELLPLTSTNLTLAIEEKESHWKRVKGSDLNDCFKKRFKISGDTDKISNNLKGLLVNYQGVFSARIGTGYLKYNNDDIYIKPAYTGEGQIMFLDFLDKVCTLLDEGN